MGRKNKVQPKIQIGEGAEDNSRNIKIANGTDERDPFYISIGYLGNSSAIKGVELDHIIMPLVRAALKQYVARRVETDAMQVQYNGLTDTTLASLTIEGKPTLYCNINGKVDKYLALLFYYQKPLFFKPE